jgi:hypothetical protein
VSFACHSWVPVSRFFDNGMQTHELGARAIESPYRLAPRARRRREGREPLAPIYGWFTEGFDRPDRHRRSS